MILPLNNNCLYTTDFLTCSHKIVKWSTLLKQHLCFRLNREAKQNLEMDWSDKKEALEIDTSSGALRNEHTNKQFYPGAAKFQEM